MEKSPWLHAWHDPVAGIKAYSPCVRLADLNGDGDHKLLVGDSDRRVVRVIRVGRINNANLS
jgi:Bardet-Biedl syndrome 1 protein